jgi:hypothetical protein
VLLTGQTAALASELDDVLFESRGRQTVRNVRDQVELVAAVRQGQTSDGGLAIDPVCRMAVDPDRAAGRLIYNGTATPLLADLRGGVRARSRPVYGLTEARNSSKPRDHCFAVRLTLGRRCERAGDTGDQRRLGFVLGQPAGGKFAAGGVDELEQDRQHPVDR